MAVVTLSGSRPCVLRQGLLSLASRRYSNSWIALRSFVPGAGSCSGMGDVSSLRAVGMSRPSICYIAATAALFGSATATCNRRFSSLTAAATQAETRAAADGDAVLVDYEGRLEDGTVFDSSEGRSPLSLTLGKGQVVPGFEEAIIGLLPGQTKEVIIPPEKGYGARNEQLVMTVDKDKVPAGLKEGMSVTLNSGGRPIPAQVVKVAEDGAVTIDVNPPLAGKTLVFKITLAGFRELLAQSQPPEGLELATFAAGCFWGVELAFQRIEGVVSTAVGYAQGQREAPTYEDICTGTTGHTEAVRVVFNPEVVSFSELLETFWKRVGNNATTLNRAGNDTGPQYRSGIYFHSVSQEAEGKASIQALQERLGEKVVTELENASPFWLAEDYHQQYLEKGKPQSAAKGCDEEIRCYG
eukprot:TRINITY_DN33977_c0_g1_i1.p1 TRINITY_DN33977_c0_g1~~TRINITY_DN33977_c0_g1_i1.p1  ORF type:complete len:412 (-),score=59.65 TRINITY_DN33977_c0_g1_i1:171-1406(-)